MVSQSFLGWKLSRNCSRILILALFFTLHAVKVNFLAYFSFDLRITVYNSILNVFYKSFVLHRNCLWRIHRNKDPGAFLLAHGASHLIQLQSLLKNAAPAYKIMITCLRNCIKFNKVCTDDTLFILAFWCHHIVVSLFHYS